VVIGVLTTTLSRSATSPAVGGRWRFAAWSVSVAIFAAHILISRRQPRRSVRQSAGQVAVAVAAATCVLALAGPVRKYWGEPHAARVALLSVALWPVLTGIPSFVVALVAGRVLDRVTRPADESPVPS